MLAAKEESITTDEFTKANALADVATGLAATDPDRAERITQSITREGAKAGALCGIAQALAATDPDRAERIARSITDEVWRARSLVAIADGCGSSEVTARGGCPVSRELAHVSVYLTAFGAAS